MNINYSIGFENIQDLYDAYRANPYDKETNRKFDEAKASLAQHLAYLFPTREDKFGNLGEIYIIIDEFSKSGYSRHFLKDVVDIVTKRFSNKKS